MTREAAIRILGRCNANFYWEDGEPIPAAEIAAAVEMAIEALEAAPVRCAECRFCYDVGEDPMVPYDGESEWYCEKWDEETSAYGTDPYRFYCADGERRE